MAKNRNKPNVDHGETPYQADGLAADSDWPIDMMPPMPFQKGLAMAVSSTTELYVHQGRLDQSLFRQHMLAVYESDRKWQAEQSRLKTEAAHRFRIRAAGWASLASAFGLGSIITLVTMIILRQYWGA